MQYKKRAKGVEILLMKLRNPFISLLIVLNHSSFFKIRC